MIDRPAPRFTRSASKRLSRNLDGGMRVCESVCLNACGNVSPLLKRALLLRVPFLLQLEMKLSSSCSVSLHRPGVRSTIGRWRWHQTNLSPILNSQVARGASPTLYRLPTAVLRHLTRCIVLAHVLPCRLTVANIACQLRHRRFTCRNTDPVWQSHRPPWTAPGKNCSKELSFHSSNAPFLMFPAVCF